MKTLDSIFPTSSTSNLAAEPAALVSHHVSKKAAEPFESLMKRALSKPAREPEEKDSKADAPVHETRSSHAPKNEGSAVRKPKASAHPEPPADPAAPAVVNPEPSVREAAPEKSEAEGSVHDAPSAAATAPVETPASAAPAVAVEDQSAATMQSLAATVAAPVLQPTMVTTQAPAITGTGKAGKGPELISPITSDTPTKLAEVAEQITIAEPSSKPDAKLAAEPPKETPVAVFDGANKSEPANTVVPALAEMISEPAAKERAEPRKEIPFAAVVAAKKSDPADSAVPIQALLDQAGPQDENPAANSDPTAYKPRSPLSGVTGTSAAQQTVTMKPAEQSAKVAGVPGQPLPAETSPAASEAAAHTRPAARPPARSESSDSSSTLAIAGTNRAPSAPEMSGGNLISAASQTELRTRALERTHDILALHGVQLKQSNTDSLHVVIKPGAGLQLSLQMKQTSDGIEAQAVLQQGNFNDLNRHWTELQQRLEERGIRLAPLSQDGAAANSGHEHFQRQSHQPAQPDALSAGTFAEFASAGVTSAGSLPAAAVAPSRGWEGWA